MVIYVNAYQLYNKVWFFNVSHLYKLKYLFIPLSYMC